MNEKRKWDLLDRLFRLWDKHPYNQTLDDYYEETEIVKKLKENESQTTRKASKISK